MREERTVWERKQKETLKKNKYKTKKQANECKDEGWISQRGRADGEIKAKMQEGKMIFTENEGDWKDRENE